MVGFEPTNHIGQELKSCVVDHLTSRVYVDLIADFELLYGSK